MTDVPEEIAMTVPRPRSRKLALVVCKCGQMFTGPDREGLYQRHWLRNHAESDPIEQREEEL